MRMGRATVAAAVAVLTMGSGAASAQIPDGYLLKRPRVTVNLKGIFDQPRAQGGIYDFTRGLLTLDAGDFAAVGGGLSVSIRAADRLDIAFETSIGRSESRSEFRDFVEETDQGDLPIEQTTSLRRQSFGVSARVFPFSRGRTVGSFAWIPTEWSPYFGAGVGRTGYRFVQEGDFVDVDSLEIFTDYLQSEDGDWSWHAFGGAEIGLNSVFLISAEGRYTWATPTLAGDFVNFDTIDLSGFQFALGIGVRL